MRIAPWLAALVTLPLLAACDTGPNPVTNALSGAEAPVAAAGAGLVPVPVSVPPGAATAPFDEPREALVPAGWTMSVFARVPNARLAVWSPDGELLVSVPDDGRVLALSRTGAQRPLLTGLTQPHGLAFSPDGTTLYVAESNQVSAFTWAGGAATGRRVVVPGLPDANSPDLRGAYGHELKSVTVGPDGAVYVSVGSTGNISVADRDATPPRASILRMPPTGGPAAPFATGVRNGTGLATAPDGAIWTAVNGRDNVPYPYDRSYGDDTGSSFGKVVDGYVTDHRPSRWPGSPRAASWAGRSATRIRTPTRASRGPRRTSPTSHWWPTPSSTPAGARWSVRRWPRWSSRSRRTRRRWGCRSPRAHCPRRTRPEHWPGCTAPGTRTRREHRRCRSSRGGTGASARSRPWSAGSRTRRERAGAGRSRPSPGRTEWST